MYLIGNGIDNHKLIKLENENKITLGTIKINSIYKIVAHSDGDIILHSLCNSILGALSLNDIGYYFNDSDSNNKDLNSIKIFELCQKFMNDKNVIFSNIDLTIVCEKIFLKDYKNIIKKQLINLTKCNNISIKATRYEQDIDMISCYCSILLKKND